MTTNNSKTCTSFEATLGITDENVSRLLLNSPLFSFSDVSFNCKRPIIKKVIFNDPATIVFFEDGHKEVVKVKPGEKFDKWTGLAMCVMKRMYGPGFHGLFKKWCGKE